MLNQPHKATVDSSGNIILPGIVHTEKSEPVIERIVTEVSTDNQSMEEGMWYSPGSIAHPRTIMWDMVNDEDVPAPTNIVAEDIVENPFDPFANAPITLTEIEGTVVDEISVEPAKVWNEMRGQLTEIAGEVLSEGSRQYRTSFVEGAMTARGVVDGVKSGAKRTWMFLTQPVWIPGRNNEPKQHARSVLFFLDIVRFGGTFAALFLMLFAALNYQSFWAIAKSHIDPLSESAIGSSTAEGNESALAEKLKRIPSLSVAGQSNSNLAAFLPLVGPPDNRLIIPSLDLNVPIVVPPTDALLKEDWKKLEEDIQTSLQDGVAHYPGTARPGQAGNFFVTGHSSYFPWAPGAYKSVFARLHELKVGDEYWVFYGGDRHRYVISGKKEIKPSDVTVLDQPVQKRVSTLMTCTPVGTTLRRLIITAQEVDPVTGLALEVGEREKRQEQPATKLEMLPI